MTLIYSAGRQLGGFCFNVFGRLEITGQDAVPPYAPLIVVANHVSFNDPPVLVAALQRKLSFIGKQELFGNPISRFFMRGFQVFPLDRSGNAVEMVRLALGLLAQDRALVIFPEGHRSPTHSLQEGLPGAAYLAIKSQATILPVAVTGTEKFPGWRMLIPFCRFRVVIGQPFTLPALDGIPSREVLKSMTDMIMYRIAVLLPKEYRGVYAMPVPSQPGRLAPAQSGGASGTATG